MGAGADERRPLGLCVVGGLIFAQFVTLYLTPVFYTYMEALSGWLARERPREVKFDHPQSDGATAPFGH
jgi:HAE1 family hydrophobic/amphiphilic exporter-1